jgi:hypothetical protein
VGKFYFWDSEDSESLKSIVIATINGDQITFEKGDSKITVSLNALIIDINAVKFQIKKVNVLYLSNCGPCLQILTKAKKSASTGNTITNLTRTISNSFGNEFRRSILNSK